ncbi:hypothetical protein ScalyP_jg11669 [Parmales sp. scaly parma]|nr:hypothetical protein ScalyP_jg11669 [Parmales sp. scaly parma]
MNGMIYNLFGDRDDVNFLLDYAGPDDRQQTNTNGPSDIILKSGAVFPGGGDGFNEKRDSNLDFAKLLLISASILEVYLLEANLLAHLENGLVFKFGQYFLKQVGIHEEAIALDGNLLTDIGNDTQAKIIDVFKSLEDLAKESVGAAKVVVVPIQMNKEEDPEFQRKVVGHSLNGGVPKSRRRKRGRKKGYKPAAATIKKHKETLGLRTVEDLEGIKKKKVATWRKKAKGEGDAIPGILSEMMSSGEQRSPKDWNKAKKLRNALEPEYGRQYKKRVRR